MVLDERNDLLVGHLVEQVGLGDICILGRAGLVFFAPLPGDGVDVEAELIFVLATAPAPVDAPDLRGGCIGERGKSIFSGAIQAGYQRLVLGNLAVGPG